MPITQDRLKLLIDAGTNLEAAYLGLVENLARTCAQYRRGQINAEQLVNEISALAQTAPHEIINEQYKIQREQTWWLHTHGRNEREARRLAKRRAEGRGELYQALSPKVPPSYHPTPSAAPKLNHLPHTTQTHPLAQIYPNMSAESFAEITRITEQIERDEGIGEAPEAPLAIDMEIEEASAEQFEEGGGGGSVTLPEH